MLSKTLCAFAQPLSDRHHVNSVLHCGWMRFKPNVPALYHVQRPALCEQTEVYTNIWRLATKGLVIIL
jgi:hypothetical protein